LSILALLVGLSALNNGMRSEVVPFLSSYVEEHVRGSPIVDMALGKTAMEHGDGRRR
jgi:hypothetical protein